MEVETTKLNGFRGPDVSLVPWNESADKNSKILLFDKGVENLL